MVTNVRDQVVFLSTVLKNEFGWDLSHTAVFFPPHSYKNDPVTTVTNLWLLQASSQLWPCCSWPQQGALRCWLTTCRPQRLLLCQRWPQSSSTVSTSSHWHRCAVKKNPAYSNVLQSGVEGWVEICVGKMSSSHSQVKRKSEETKN